MNQYSIKITRLQHAIIIQTILSPLIGAWTISFIPGDDDYKFTFTSTLDFDSVERKLKEINELDITFLQYEN